MNGLDVFLIVILVVAAASGFRRGAALQVFSYTGLLLGLLVGAVIAPRVAGSIEGSGARTGVALGTLLLAGAVGDALGWLVGSRARLRTRSSRFGSADAAGGSLVALLATLLAIWFISLNLVNGPFPEVASEIRGSAIVRGLGTALPDPPSVVGEMRRLFDRFGFPDVFQGIPPEPGEAVEGPTPSQTQRAYEAAAASTVRIDGRACDSIVEGSGFVVAPGYVVTNAHVVAGVGAPDVRAAGGVGGTADTVLFDPNLDLAVLRLDAPLGPALSFANEDEMRGTVGAVLGYPEGGPLIASGAAVREPILAVGHDIYGRDDIERNVYELQVEVHPGNSGGPFVLPDGTVAGVVFAASSVDPEVGYAIRASEILDEVRLALTRTTAVSTGPCIG